MKIIAFGDIHEHTKNISNIKGLGNADYVVVTGDITNYGGKKKAKKILDLINSCNSNIYAQYGNLDKKEVNDYLDELGINLHANGFVQQGIGIFGVGGSNPTPFNTPTEFSERQIENFLQKGYEKVKQVPVNIMVSHAPPINTKLDIVSGTTHVGSSSVRKFIETFQPNICLTGHIHESAGIDQIGNTTILNPGMLKNGGYIEVTINDGNVTGELKKIR
ncbi:MAG: metallophosphoesterase [Desulfosarcina sp.]|nr:metallophosphoesterase [Desulfobacterales bacterium]